MHHLFFLRGALEEIPSKLVNVFGGSLGNLNITHHMGENARKGGFH